MKRLVSRRPSPALIVAVVALVVAMVGTGYAASQLPKNSVGTKQIKKNAVTGAKVKDKSLTGKDVNLNKLGTVPSANVANGFASTESVHIVGAPGEPPFLNGSTNIPSEPESFQFQPVGFFKDHDGVVHLEGVALSGKSGPLAGEIFQLPAGFRPASGKTLVFQSAGSELPVFVFGSSVTISGFNLDGIVYAPNAGGFLGGISFKAQS